jgi:hypothetical protein
MNEKRGALLRYDATSGKYDFSDPVYRAFATALLRKVESQKLSVTVTIDGLLADSSVWSNASQQVIGWWSLEPGEGPRRRIAWPSPKKKPDPIF